jgi:tellurite methyltransferase
VIHHVPRAIVGFLPDADADGVWIAELECGHRRHVRHRPPQSSYPWILDGAGRAAKIGAPLECSRCARLELPEGATVYRTTDVFDEHTLPAGLRREHTTRRGVWGRAEVLAGAMRFVMPALEIDRELHIGEHAIIPPELVHWVEPRPGVRMRVAFLKPAVG